MENKKPKIVISYRGKSVLRTDCVKIKSNYYIKNEECMFIEGKWYRNDSDLIAFNHELGTWFVKSNASVNICQGIISIDKDGNPVLGYFTQNPYNNVMTHLETGRSYLAINSEILDLSRMFISDGDNWYSKKGRIPSPQKKSFAGNGYNIEDNSYEFETKTFLYNEFRSELSKDVRIFAKIFGDTTFGIEVETISGYLPVHKQNQLGLVICKDGSLNIDGNYSAAEYVSVILSGAKGLQTVKNIGDSIAPGHTTDIHCSYHVHLGNLPTTRLFIVTLYKLCCMIQADMYKMFPPYKSDPSLIDKEKDYNKPLKPLGIYEYSGGGRESFKEYVDNAYNNIFYFLTNGTRGSSDYNRKNKNHPRKSKWDRVSRYYWVNFMNIFFSNRDTIEFRLHHGTTNSQKMVNWLFMCNAIVRFAANNSELILTSKTIPVQKIFNFYTDNNRSESAKLLSDYLNAYYESRCKDFKEARAKSDYSGKTEYYADKVYNFNFNNITNLF